MVEPVEPDIYALADVLLQQTAVFGQGFAEWRDLTIRKAKFLSKKRGMAERAAASLRPVLAALVAATDVFTERSRHIFKLVADPIASGFYSATDTIDDALPVAINAIGALALNLAEKLHTLGSIGGGIWAMSAIAGDPNMVLVREVIDSTRVFFLDHQDIIGLFANDHDELRRLVSGTMSRLSPASIIAETNQTAAYPNPLPKDFDYEGEAEKLILAGKAPQKEWVPRIKRLAFFDDQTLVDLSPLAGLTALTRLDLSSTGVTDVSPLSGLTGLSELDLHYTGVADVALLVGLKSLRHLDLGMTHVDDISALSNMGQIVFLGLAGRGPLILPTSMPTVDELVLLGRSWPADVPLPPAKYRIDPDGSVHTPGDKAPGWFISWIDDAATFRETGKLPGES